MYPVDPENVDKYVYEGKAIIEEEEGEKIYDKWSKYNGYETEPGEEGTNLYTTPKFYVYTNEVISISEGINPLDYPEKIDEVYETGYTNGVNDVQVG
jgi:hypothetical protein